MFFSHKMVNFKLKCVKGAEHYFDSSYPRVVLRVTCVRHVLFLATNNTDKCTVLDKPRASLASATSQLSLLLSITVCGYIQIMG